ncbi:hypothetical protein [Levilactobacillus fujinensis]|uniref:Uncharacterized protein n=1 Tax=Levilactobacillus fujinensis TaxID=2486024 RepID=A0ABW1TJF2_9LACO
MDYLVIRFKRSQLPFVPRFSNVNLEIAKESGVLSQTLIVSIFLFEVVVSTHQDDVTDKIEAAAAKGKLDITEKKVVPGGEKVDAPLDDKEDDQADGEK